MNKDELIVFGLLSKHKKITQLEIARSDFWLGSHPVHEAHLNIDHQQSTLRKIRQIIRDLRIKHGVAILSDRYGYWLMNDEKEAQEYIQRLEKVAKSQAKAWFITYQAMKKNFNVKSEFLEKITT